MLLPTGLPTTAMGAATPGPKGSTRMLLPGSLLLLLRLLLPLSLLLRDCVPSLLPCWPVPSVTGLLRHSRARDRSLKADHRLLAVADVAASSEEDRRCSRRSDVPLLLLLTLLLLPLLEERRAAAESMLLDACSLGGLTWCSRALLLVVRIACARIMWGCCCCVLPLLLRMATSSSASTMRSCAGVPARLPMLFRGCCWS